MPGVRLVRRKSLLDRVKDYLNPWDFLLWLSEEFETRDWDSKKFVGPLGFGFHIVFLVARANSGSGGGYGDDVFGDDYGTSWMTYIASFLVYLLTGLSIANAAYTFSRKRHYRLFESPIEAPQSTPSAHRVRVDSSPVSSSPLRFLTNILGDPSAESRAHPDPTRDVWELAVWDPLPLCLGLFCTFSPGHVLVYWLFLPTLASDPRPSTTVITTIVLQILLSSQSLFLQSAFSQQIKDSAIIQKEVMSEYDIKFVHPRINPTVRDVATQCSSTIACVETYTPTVILKREFRTQPNPNYVKHLDPDYVGGITQRNYTSTPSYTPAVASSSRESTPFSSGITPRHPMRQPQFRQSTPGAPSAATSTGDGGSLGIYSHANSPLKKASSMYDIQDNARRQTPKNSYDMARQEIHEQRDRSASPAKRQSTFLPGGRALPDLDNDRRMSAPAPPGQRQRPTPYESAYRRGPSRIW